MNVTVQPYSEVLRAFQSDLRRRFTAQGFSLEADFASGRVKATKGRFEFEFSDGAQAERFIHGYEFAVDDVTDWLRRQE